MQTFLQKKTPHEKHKGLKSKTSGNSFYCPIQLMLDSENGQIVTARDRAPFSQELLNAMQVNHGENRCHIISYKSITQSTADALQSLNIGYFNKKQAVYHLFMLFQSVYPYAPDDDIFPQNRELQRLYNENYHLAEAVINYIGTNLTQETLIDSGNALINLLNNSPANLRPGDSTTNQSIGNMLDPLQTDIIRKEQDNEVSFEITGQSAFQIASLYKVSPREVQFGVSSWFLQTSDIPNLTVENMGPAPPQGYISVRITPPGECGIDPVVLMISS